MEKNKFNDLDEEEKEILRKHHETKRKALLAELSQIESKIQHYGGEPMSSKSQAKIPFTGSSFPKTVVSVPAKTVHALSDRAKISTIGEVVERYARFEPSLIKGGKVVRSKYAQIYAALLTKIKTGAIIRVKGVDDDTYKYGLKEWFNEDGTPKPQYRND